MKRGEEMKPTRRNILESASAGLMAGLAVPDMPGATSGREGAPRTASLAAAHLAAVNRKRCVIVNFDTNFGAPSILRELAGMDIDRLVKAYFSMIDEKGVQIDSVWWCWLDGNYANYPSKVLPVWDLPG